MSTQPKRVKPPVFDEDSDSYLSDGTEEAQDDTSGSEQGAQEHRRSLIEEEEYEEKVKLFLKRSLQHDLLSSGEYSGGRHISAFTDILLKLDEYCSRGTLKEAFDYAARAGLNISQALADSEFGPALERFARRSTVRKGTPSGASVHAIHISEPGSPSLQIIEEDSMPLEVSRQFSLCFLYNGQKTMETFLLIAWLILPRRNIF